MAAEKNLYKMVKEKLKEFHPIRIETSTFNGFPDFVLFNKNKKVLFIECKACESSKLLHSLSPHQKLFHSKYSELMEGLFILQRVLSERRIFLYRSKDSNFLLQKTSLEPCAEVELSSDWGKIKKILNDQPLHLDTRNAIHEARAENGEK